MVEESSDRSVALRQGQARPGSGRGLVPVDSDRDQGAAV